MEPGRTTTGSSSSISVIYRKELQAKQTWQSNGLPLGKAEDDPHRGSGREKMVRKGKHKETVRSAPRALDFEEGRGCHSPWRTPRSGVCPS